MLQGMAPAFFLTRKPGWYNYLCHRSCIALIKFRGMKEERRKEKYEKEQQSTTADPAPETTSQQEEEALRMHRSDDAEGLRRSLSESIGGTDSTVRPEPNQ